LGVRVNLFSGWVSTFMHRSFPFAPYSLLLISKTTYVPMIYTGLCMMLWMRAYPLLGEVGRGWALESRDFGPQMARAYRLDAISQGLKNF
jgi:hypothetical protein